MRKLVVAIAVAVMALGGSACATKKFVRTSVGEVNDKVGSLSKSLEETQERTRQNETRIGEVDQRAQAAAQSAQQANSAAAAAATTANSASNMANTLDKANRRLVYEVVLNEDQGNFKSGQAVLPDSAKQQISDLINKIKQDPKNVYFEIEGHTDNTGGKLENEKLGLDRAEAVQRFLHEQFQIPLHKINVISYGQEKPIASNKTRDGRAQNRRVVIRVLA
jgi:peptidoglycan-associated lipoprotein